MEKKILLSESDIMALRDILNIAEENIDSWGQNPFRSPSCNINDNLEPVFKFIEEKGGNINRKSLKKFPAVRATANSVATNCPPSCCGRRAAVRPFFHVAGGG